MAEGKNKMIKCIKCGGNNWEQKQRGFLFLSICKKCGHVFNQLDYITSGKINANSIKAVRLKEGIIK